ncbi:MAG: copper-binding protein [Hyphomicrobium sp.]|nr:copper-binding protein [Hyphomicrobium sp.]
MQLGGALALSLLLAACGDYQNAGTENRQGADAGPSASQTGEFYSATGEVTAIAGNQVTISHGPVEGLGWPAMTMSFGAGSPEMIEGVRVGDRVSFKFHQDNGTYTLSSLSKGG